MQFLNSPDWLRSGATRALEAKENKEMFWRKEFIGSEADVSFSKVRTIAGTRILAMKE